MCVFDTDFELVRTIEKCGEGPGEFNWPTDVCTGYDEKDPDSLVVADSGNYRLQVLTPTGEHVRTIPFHDVKPSGVCTDSRGDIYTTLRSHCVAVFSWTGEPLRMFGSAGEQLGMFDCPDGICFDERHQQLFVADRCNERVQVFTPDGAPVGMINMQDHDLARRAPAGVCVYMRGSTLRVAVSEATDGVVELYTWDGKRACLDSIIGEWGEEPRQFADPDGVCADSRGRLLVSDWGNSRIQAIEPSTEPRVGLLGCLLATRLDNRDSLPECL